MNRYKKYVYAGLPVLGVLFYLLYLNRSAIDMIYSDYIRLINSYLPDVWNPDKFFVPDLLTRIPVNYLERGINVQLFGYSVTFDRVMGVLGFGLSALVLASYSRKWKLGLGWYGALMVVMFSLNKWEMLYNGTGWAHFLAFAFFYYNYLVLDRVYGGKGKKRDLVCLFLLPAITTIGVAGPYCAIYSMTLLLAYGFIFIKDRLTVRNSRRGLPAEKRSRGEKKDSPAGVARLLDRKLSPFSAGKLLGLAAAAAAPLLLYLWSNSQAVYEYSGAVSDPLLSSFFREPKFFLTFFLKSFSSMIFGIELITRHMEGLPGEVLCLLGLLVIGAYVFALWMNFYYRIYERTIFPLMLLAAGGMNHLLVLATRWIFIPNDLYGMSSRYALQYQVGILGILLTFGLAARLNFERKGRKKSINPAVVRGFALGLCLVFLGGNLATTGEEFSYGIHRKNHNENDVKPILLNFENETEETLKSVLEFHKDGTKEALSILKEHGWNIFKETKEQEGNQ